MAQDYVQLQEDEAAVVQLGVQLVGAAARPVRAWLTLASQQNSTAWLAEEADAWLSTSQLTWAANETGVRYVRLRSALELLGDMEDGELVLRISRASGADIQPERAATLLSLEQREPPLEPAGSAAPQFAFVPNQVAYAGLSSEGSQVKGSSSDKSVARIPVQLVSGRLVEPATVRYTVSLLTLAEKQFLPTRALSGFLLFSPNASTEQSISLPVAWERVPLEAEYRLGASTEASAGAGLLAWVSCGLMCRLARARVELRGQLMRAVPAMNGCCVTSACRLVGHDIGWLSPLVPHRKHLASCRGGAGGHVGCAHEESV
jgi:hypothetical protein